LGRPMGVGMEALAKGRPFRSRWRRPLSRRWKIVLEPVRRLAGEAPFAWRLFLITDFITKGRLRPYFDP
jgi:hypothetical protein